MDIPALDDDNQRRQEKGKGKLVDARTPSNLHSRGSGRGRRRPRTGIVIDDANTPTQSISRAK